MIRLKEYHKRSDGFCFALTVSSGSEEFDRDTSNLHIALFRHSWWFTIPRIVKHKEKEVHYVSGDPPVKKQYIRHVRREYGFLFNEEAIFLYYGSQPGEWIRNDPANSDHVKVFWWPWQPTIVRHDLLLPNGDLYWRNTYPRGDRQHLHLYEIENIKSDVQVQVFKYVTLTHTTKDGRVQTVKIRLGGEEREWRPKVTRWLPIFRTNRRVVDCYSNVELGERAGEWKGGLMGWSCEWKQGEEMEDAFWRWYKTWDGR